MIFCALELVTISLYIQVAYTRRSLASLEAGTKFLVLGALSTGFFIYGITWIFGMTGETNLALIQQKLEEVENDLRQARAQSEKVNQDLRTALQEAAQMRIQESALKEHMQQVRGQMREKEQETREAVNLAQQRASQIE
jgi:hypothetical protein